MSDLALEVRDLGARGGGLGFGGIGRGYLGYLLFVPRVGVC